MGPALKTLNLRWLFGAADVLCQIIKGGMSRSRDRLTASFVLFVQLSRGFNRACVPVFWGCWMNHQKPADFRPQQCILSQPEGPETQNWFYWLEIKLSSGLLPPTTPETLGRVFLPRQLWWLPACVGRVSFLSTSASVVIVP